MVRDVESLRIGPHPHRPLVFIDPDHERVSVLMESNKQLSTDFERRRAVGRALLDPGKEPRPLTHYLEADRSFLSRAIPRSCHGRSPQSDVLTQRAGLSCTRVDYTRKHHERDGALDSEVKRRGQSLVPFPPQPRPTESRGTRGRYGERLGSARTTRGREPSPYRRRNRRSRSIPSRRAIPPDPPADRSGRG